MQDRHALRVPCAPVVLKASVWCGCSYRHRPATALAVYDESWALARDAARLMERVTGNSPVMDTLGFFVDPRAGYKGFSPHRDRQPEDWMARGLPEDPRATFRPDGTAKYATVWIALTAANSDSSCLHLRRVDWTYGSMIESALCARALKTSANLDSAAS